MPTHSSNTVEHPETIAQRIARFASVVGRESVIAGADCGFASFASTCAVHPSGVWAKLQALGEGAIPRAHEPGCAMESTGRHVSAVALPLHPIRRFTVIPFAKEAAWT